MRATIEFLQRKFDEFNSLCFGGELPRLPLRLGNSRRSLGMFVHRRGISLSDPRRESDCHISISTRFDLDERVIEDTLIHEMIHYYIWHKRIRDRSAHGPVFTGLMKDINRRFGRNLKVTHHASEEESSSDNHIKQHYICVLKLRNGETGIIVCARTRIFEMHRMLAFSPEIESIEWYCSKNPWFNRFPVSRTMRYYKLSPADRAENFADATPCICDGLERVP